MKKVFGHVIKIVAVLVMIICWILAIGYTNELGLMKNTFNLYLEDESYGVADIYELQKKEAKQEESVLFTGWYEKENQQVINSNFNRTLATKIVLICGNSSVIANGPLLFADDKDGCLIDRESAYKLFGSTDIIGNTLTYDNRELTIRGIHHGMEDTIIMQALEDSTDILQGISIDISNGNKDNIKLLSERYGFKEEGVNSIIYYNIGKICTSLLPIIILIIMVINIIKRALSNKRKPFFLLFDLILLAISIYIFFKITKYKISIPVDILPNKWSDFDYWQNFYQESKEKVKYVLYMKKYSMDIYPISYIIKIIWNTIITLVLLFINIRNIKITSIKELFIALSAIIIIIYISLIICINSNINEGSLIIIWLIPIYYLIYKYISLNKEKLLRKIS